MNITDEFAAEHLDLVRAIVWATLRHVPAHVEHDEFVSAGLLALTQAARSYDETRGVPFRQWAGIRIHGAILDELRGADWASRSVRTEVRRRDAAVEQLTHILDRAPTTRELATHLGIPTKTLSRVESNVQRSNVLSLQGFFSHDRPVEDFIRDHHPSPEDVLLHKERLAYLLDGVAELPDKQRTVITGYYLRELPMADLAAELGVTESRISQIRAEGLTALRDCLKAVAEPPPVTHTFVDGVAIRRRQAYHAAVADRRSWRSRLTTTGVAA